MGASNLAKKTAVRTISSLVQRTSTVSRTTFQVLSHVRCKIPRNLYIGSAFFGLEKQKAIKLQESFDSRRKSHRVSEVSEILLAFYW